MNPLWTSDALAKATGGTASTAFAVGGVAFDSREIGKDDLFLALKGEQSDGHLFVEKAFAAGAAAAIVSEPVAGPHILVADTMAALNDIAKASRQRIKAKVIGVTGSVGKTGTKEALYAALARSSHNAAHRSVKSYNNHVGVPLSLARMPAESQFAIFEMGMNHAGELSELTQLVQPDAAIITTVGPSHIGNFSDGEIGIANAKAEIFEGLVAGGTAIIPFDNPHHDRLRQVAARYTDKIVSFGFSQGADVRALDVVAAPHGGSLVTAQIGAKNLCFTIAETGEHWVSNALAILAAVDAVGGDLAIAGLALAELSGIDGRGKRHQLQLRDGGSATLVDESYNANPASMKATLKNFRREVVAGNRILVLGAMGELGIKSKDFHFQLAQDIVDAQATSVVLVGDDMQYTVSGLQQTLAPPRDISHVATASEALTEVAKIISDGDALLVKGSNYLGLASVVTALVRGEY